jgi:hypothetical protein
VRDAGHRDPAARTRCARTRIDGVLVQPMVVRPKARELVAGLPTTRCSARWSWSAAAAPPSK